MQRIHEGMARPFQQPQRTCLGNHVGEKKNSGSGEVGYVTHLEQRCRQLAARLVSLVRDRQLSECSEIHFFLRAQEEERLFLRDALLTLLKKHEGYTDDDGADKEWRLENGVSLGMLSALMMRVTDSVQRREAQMKLEKVESLAVLEQTTNLIVELQRAIEKATRWVYNYHFDFFSAAPSQQLTLWKEPCNLGSGKAHSLKDTTPNRLPLSSSQTKQSGNYTEWRWREDADSPVDPVLPFVPESAAATTLRQGDLLEACDILRACHRALGDVCLLLGGVMSTSTCISSLKGDKEINLDRLLKEFQQDLREMARSNAESKEKLARRLMAEIEAHRQTVKTYEARLRLAEKELIDYLTASTQLAQMPLRSNDVSSSCKHFEKEAENNISATGVTPPPPPLSSSSPTSICRSAARGDIVRYDSTPENFVPLLRLSGGGRSVLGKHYDSEPRGQEKKCVLAAGGSSEGVRNRSVSSHTHRELLTLWATGSTVT